MHFATVRSKAYASNMRSSQYERQHTPTAFGGPVVDHWLEWKVAQTANASAMQDRSIMQEDPNLYSKVLYRLSFPTDRSKACASNMRGSHYERQYTPTAFGGPVVDHWLE